MRAYATAALLLMLCIGSARADSTADEIAYLIDFIRHSSCTFIRNGSEYSGAAAADHVQAKFEHYKDEIKSVEDFIARAATKSELTGRPYQVRCTEALMPAAAWIRAEDSAYRARQSEGASGN